MPLEAAGRLLTLTRGEDELLLVEPRLFRPLYVRQGRRYVLDFLSAAAALGSGARIRAAFPVDGDLLDSLLFHGILAPREEDPETAPYHGCGCGPREASAGCDSPAISLYLLLSNACNLACGYCLNGRQSYGTARERRMSRETAVAAVERCLAELSPGGSLEVVFFGGEPLRNWETAKATILECEGRLSTEFPGKAIRYHVTSNLTVLPPDLIPWAAKYGITFLCDVDGPRDLHDACRPMKGGGGSHDAVVDSIRRLVDAGLRVDLRATITARNHDRLPEIARHHKAIGGSSCAFVPVSPVDSDEEIMDEGLLPSPAKMLDGVAAAWRSGVWETDKLYPLNLHAPRLRPGTSMTQGCGLPYGNTPVVDASGDAFPCIYLVGIGRFRMGNVHDGTFPDRRLLASLHDALHVDALEGCKGCAMRTLCGGGCPVWRLTIAGNPKVSGAVAAYCREIGCDYTRGLIEMLLWEQAAAAASNVMEGFRGRMPA
jgi:uncharacterized protein